MTMKKLLLFLLTFWMSAPSWAGKVITDSIHSRVLGSTVKYNVYLPTGYETSSQKFPVVYLLHGLYGTYKDWAMKANVRGVADEMIKAREAVPMVIIMPNAGHPDVRHQWNGYFNMPGWDYETFFFTEMMPAVEKKYHTYTDKGHRAVMGLSMGGGASTVYCQHHPELFSSSFAMSAWVDTTEPEAGSHGKDKLYYVCKSVRDHSAIDFMLNADEATKQRLRTVRWFFDCGDDDPDVEYSFRLHQLCVKAGLSSELRIRDGAHNWEYWHSSLRLALPFASINFREVQ